MQQGDPPHLVLAKPVVTAVASGDAFAFAATSDGVSDVMDDATLVNRVHAALHTPGLALVGVARDLVDGALDAWPIQLPEEEEVDNVTGLVGLFRH